MSRANLPRPLLARARRRGSAAGNPRAAGSHRSRSRSRRHGPDPPQTQLEGAAAAQPRAAPARRAAAGAAAGAGRCGGTGPAGPARSVRYRELGFEVTVETMRLTIAVSLLCRFYAFVGSVKILFKSNL